MDYTLSVCPDCGGRTTPLDLAPRIVQQVEVVAAPTTVCEHRGQACYCGRCQKTHYAEIPAASCAACAPKSATAWTPLTTNC